MKEGGQILAAILKQLVAAAKPGLTTESLDKLAAELISSHKAKASFLGYEGFPASICTSINEEIVHGLPSDRKLITGDVLKIDVGIYYKGYHTDTAATVIVGGDDDKEKNKLVNVTNEALRIGISKAKAGNTIGDIGAAIQNFVEANGFNVIRDLVGHGIGKDLHEEPQVLNYGPAGEGEILKPGMVICIEPMVVTGSHEIGESEDGHTYVTADGGLAAQSEHTVAITDDKPLILTLNS